MFNPDKSHLSQKELKEQGYIIDHFCYPNIAYKGPRFGPDECFDVLTEKEYQMSETIKRLNKKLIDTIKALDTALHANPSAYSFAAEHKLLEELLGDMIKVDVKY